MVLTSKTSEDSTIFSIGMVLMSLLLSEDCSDCYDFRNFSFCRSLFEEKKEKIEALSNKQILRDRSYSQVTSSIEEELANLTLLAFVLIEHRVSFKEFKQKYFQILRKLSSGCESEAVVSTKRQEKSVNTVLRRSVVVKRTIQKRYG